MPTVASVTLNDIRAEVLDLTQPFPLAAETGNSGASTTTFTDGVHLVDTLLGGVYVGAWLLRTGPTLGANNRERRITTHNTTTGILGVSPVFFDVPAATEGYEVWSTDRPTYVERLINRALGRVRAPIDTPITTVAGTRQYDLSAETWLVRPSQVLGVVARRGTAPATEDAAVAGWRIYQDGATLWLDLGEPWSGGESLVLRALAGDDGPLVWSSASTTTTPLELVAAEAAYDLVKRPPQGLDTSPDLLDQRKDRAHQLKRELYAIRAKYASTEPVPLFAEGMQNWGIGAWGHTPGARWR